jgi:hypothetical protein
MLRVLKWLLFSAGAVLCGVAYLCSAVEASAYSEESGAVSCHRPGARGVHGVESTGSHYRDWTGRYVWLVRDATGEADRLPRDGRAMSFLDLSAGERSSESGMQHLSLLHSEREFAVRVF